MTRLLLAFLALTPCAFSAQGVTDYNPDFNSDSCYTAADLLGFLPLFGTCLDPAQNSSCSDSVLFSGSWYRTIQIGNQCWFAENLHSTTFANGDSIQLTNSASEFSTSNNPMYRSHASSNDIGYHYNYYCVQDGRNVCPSGWHVPRDDEWCELEMYIGVENPFDMCFRNGGGDALKASLDDSPSWDGTNASGFGAIPAGYVDTNGQFQLQGERSNFWSSSRFGLRAVRRRLDSANDGVNRDVNTCDNIYLKLGFSIRCLKDAE